VDSFVIGCHAPTLDAVVTLEPTESSAPSRLGVTIPSHTKLIAGCRQGFQQALA
jgi:hypothetical protein